MQRGISEVIIHERLKGKDPQDISNKLFRKYQIQVYPGDIFSWLDNFVKNLDAIKRIAQAYNKRNIVKKTNYLINEDETIFTQLPIHDNDAVQCYNNGTAGIACLPRC